MEAIERELVNALVKIIKFCDIPSCLIYLVSKRVMELGIAGPSKKPEARNVEDNTILGHTVTS